MTVAELKKFMGKTIADVDYELGDTQAYIVTTDGFALPIEVEPQYEEDNG